MLEVSSRRRKPWVVPCLLTLLVASGSSRLLAAEPQQSLPPAVSRPVDFAREIVPLLKSRCFSCHAGQAAEAGYRLDLKVELLGETNGEPLVVPGRSAESRLIERVVATDPAQRMPPPDHGPALTATEVGLLRGWIDQQLPWDDKILPPADATSDHWAFQPVRRPAIPTSSHHEWLRTPIDAFIASAHDAQGLRPNPPVERRRLARRAALTLTGLPPDSDSLEDFVGDDRPDALARFTDRLLASPRLGERWGRHWLDVARWAESEGYESNHPRPYAWRYRDYVVRSFNHDRPYDEFLRQQLAGDELTPYSDENLIATGFLAAARLSSNEEDKKLQRMAVLNDIVNAVGESVLGLTFGCAQCHNHKFDPITQRDYYRMQGFFVRGQPNNLALRDAELWSAYQAAKPTEYEPAAALQQAIYQRTRQRLLAERRARLTPAMNHAIETPPEQRTAEQRELARQADLELQVLVGQVEKEIPADDKPLYESLKKKIAEIEKTLPDKPQTWGFYSPATSPTSIDVLPMKGFYPLPFEPEELKQSTAFLLVRGDVHRPGAKLTPGWPAVLNNWDRASETQASAAHAATSPASHVSPASTLGGSWSDASSRGALVDWLVDPRHPLTARVWVNRLWHYQFGAGLVSTPGDLGLKGATPSHPELLDYLASDLVEHGWSTKRLLREMVLSNVFGLSAANDAVNNAARGRVDPENRWLWRWKPRRLVAEAIRDSVLDVSGQLLLTAGGRSSEDEKTPRRSLYVFQKRDRLPEAQRLFDAAAANEVCSRRHVSTVALQPLYLLNSPFVAEQSAAFERRILHASGTDHARQIECLFTLALGRGPTEEELEAASRFLSDGEDASRSPESWTRLRQLCQLVLNLNEFVYLE